MVDLSMSNEKLRRRGLRILEEATGASPADAKRALARSRNLRVALLMLETGESTAEARRRLKQSAGNLRLALATHFAKERAGSRAKTDVRRRKE
jgi:N-acetylmuramic acid 6-phosphate etherase